MKISPVSPSSVMTPSADAQSARINDLRSVKMTTRATPGQDYLPPVEGEAPAPDQELTIPDNNEADAKVEATQPISPQFAALAKQRRVLQQERRAFLDEKKAFEQAKQGSDAVPITRLKSDPLNVLLEAGVTYDQLAEAVMQNQKDPHVATLEAKIKALEEGTDKKFQEREAQAEQWTLAEMQKEAESLVAQGEEFELVRAMGKVPTVMKLIHRTYKETGEVMDVTEALRLVEEDLLKTHRPLLETKKLQGLQKQPEPQGQQQRPQGMRTLTNRDNASVPMSPKQRALAAFMGTLNK